MLRESKRIKERKAAQLCTARTNSESILSGMQERGERDTAPKRNMKSKAPEVPRNLAARAAKVDEEEEKKEDEIHVTSRDRQNTNKSTTQLHTDFACESTNGISARESTKSAENLSRRSETTTTIMEEEKVQSMHFALLLRLYSYLKLTDVEKGVSAMMKFYQKVENGYPEFMYSVGMKTLRSNGALLLIDLLDWNINEYDAMKSKLFLMLSAAGFSPKNEDLPKDIEYMHDFAVAVTPTLLCLIVEEQKYQANEPKSDETTRLNELRSRGEPKRQNSDPHVHGITTGMASDWLGLTMMMNVQRRDFNQLNVHLHCCQ